MPVVNKRWRDAVKDFLKYDTQGITESIEALCYCSIFNGIIPETADECYIYWNPCDRTYKRKDWGLTDGVIIVVPAGIVFLNMRTVVLEYFDGWPVSMFVKCIDTERYKEYVTIEGSARLPYLIGNSQYYDCDKKECHPTADRLVICETPLQAVKAYQKALKEDESICCLSYIDSNMADEETKEALLLPTEKYEESTYC